MGEVINESDAIRVCIPLFLHVEIVHEQKQINITSQLQMWNISITLYSQLISKSMLMCFPSTEPATDIHRVKFI